MVCPEELYDILFYEIPDFDGENIYLTSVSMWTNNRENFLGPDDYYYSRFKEVYEDIYNTLSKR